MSTTREDTEARLFCSFCGKGQDDVDKLIAGPGVYICDECVGLCNEIITECLAPTFPRPDELDDEVLLERMVALHRSVDQVDRKVAELVQALRSRGVTWQRIGEALGMSRQAAWERFSGEE